MRTFCCFGYLLALLLAGQSGCATTTPPPSESTVAALRAYHRDLIANVSSGKLTASQARDLFYTKMETAQPPLPDLDSLKNLRNQLAGQIKARHLTHEQAESILNASERDMLTRWEDMAAQDAREQREIQRLRDEQEQGLWQQKQLEQGEKVFRDRPRL